MKKDVFMKQQQVSNRFKARLQMAMLAAKANKKQIAQAANVTSPTVASWFSGSRTPSLLEIELIADFLKVNPSWLAGFSDAQIKEENDAFVLSLIKDLIR